MECVQWERRAPSGAWGSLVGVGVELSQMLHLVVGRASLLGGHTWDSKVNALEVYWSGTAQKGDSLFPLHNFQAYCGHHNS